MGRNGKSSGKARLFSLNRVYSLEIEDVRDFDDLCKKVQESYEGFDPDYETFLWIGPNGHGTNGAPVAAPVTASPPA